MLRLLPSRVLCVFARSASPSAKVVPSKDDKSFVEEEAATLASHVCINHLVQGDEPGPPIKADHEYPDWLFRLNLEQKKEFEDLDPEKDGWLYWRELRKRQLAQNRRIEKLKNRFLHLQDSPSMKRAQ